MHHLTHDRPGTVAVTGTPLAAFARAAYPASPATAAADRRQMAQAAHALTVAGAWLAANPGLPRLADGYRVCPHGDSTVIEVHPAATHGIEVLAAWAAATGTGLEITVEARHAGHCEVHVPVTDTVTIVVVADPAWLPHPLPALLAKLARGDAA